MVKDNKLYSHKNKIISLYTDEKLSTLKISKIYGVCPESIRRFLIKNGVKMRTSSISKLEPHKEKIIKMYKEENINTEEIGKRYGLNRSSVYRFLLKNGVSINIERRVKKTEKLHKCKDEVIDLYNSGTSTIKLAKFFKVHKSTIVNFLKKNGVEIKSCVDKCYRKVSKLEPHKDDIFDMQNNGYTLLDISKRYKVNRSTVSRFIKKGIESDM